jgi:hypothetical protein
MRAHRRPRRSAAGAFVLGLVLSSSPGSVLSKGLLGSPAVAAPATVNAAGTVACSWLKPQQNPEKNPDLRPFTRPPFTLPVPPFVPGPCTAADSVSVIPPGGSLPPVYVTNFGVLFDEGAAAPDGGVDAGPGGARWARYGFLCEENFGGKLPDHVARHPDGRLVMAGFDGLHVADPDTLGNSCSFARPGGSVAWKDIAEVAFDIPTAGGPGQTPLRLFALSRSPAALHVSTDDGVTFTQRYAFPPDLRLGRLFVVPAAPGARTIYVTGYATGKALVLARSEDDGATFTIDSFTSADFGRAGVLAVVEGPNPAAPDTLFLAAGAVSGADEIWRSTDRGHSWARVLTLPGSEARAGFAFGAGGDVFVAGAELGAAADRPPAHLMVSHDGGASFGPPRPSGATGPRFRCLAAAAGRLYACADPLKDDFMFGVSDDEGATWTPTAQLTDITGPRACTRGRCAATEFWLCESYGICADEPPRPEQRDAEAADAPSVNDMGGHGPFEREEPGCGCRVGGAVKARGRDGVGAFPALAIGLSLVLATTRRRRSMNRSRAHARRCRNPAAPPRRCS